MRLPVLPVCAAAAVLVVTALAPACPGAAPPPKHTCATVIDCDLGERCNAGTCESLDGEGEGDRPSTGDAIHDLCAAVSACSQPAQPVDQCVIDETQTINQLRASPNATCQAAADALTTLFACAAQQPCSVIAGSDSNALANACPNFAEAERLDNECLNVGEGEGEGDVIGEGEGEPICSLPGFDPTGTLNSLFLVDVQARLDSAVSSLCTTAFSLTLTIDASGDPSVASSGLFSLDGKEIQSLAELSAGGGDGGTVIQGVACSDFTASFVAVQLFAADGTQTNAVCDSNISP